MRTERKFNAEPRRLSASVPPRRAAVAESAIHIDVPGILDGVQDQHGNRWIRYGTRDRSIWFAVADLISGAATVFGCLSSISVTCLTSYSQTAFKREVEKHSAFRPALVAARPGWLEGIYVFGDGTYEGPLSNPREIIVTFEPSPKFTARGSLQEWRKAVAPFITNQPLPYFALALAFVGPLLRFAPSGYTNPQAEIVGKGETGKTSACMLAASVWAGNPASDIGGGELWDRTLNTLDTEKMSHRDGFLFLDEGNLRGASEKAQREFAQKAVFKFATTGIKRRMGDPVVSENAHLAMLSTTNTALEDQIEGSADVRNAAQTRMITIRVSEDAPHGVFETVPENFETAREASEAMSAIANELWGTAGRAFIKRLVGEIERDEERLKRGIARVLALYISQDRAPVGSARVQKSYALVAVAAALARRWAILPATPAPMRMIQAVAKTCPSPEQLETVDPLAAIRSYANRYAASLIEVTATMGRLMRSEFEEADGFLRDTKNGTEILIPAARFRSAFPDHENMMRKLRASGNASTETGQNPKLTIKTPKAICDEGRVYCIRLRETHQNDPPSA